MNNFFTTLAANSVNLNPLPDISSTQDSFVQTVITIVIRVLAAVCFLFIIIGGLRYVLSQGDPQGVSKAKGTILYALIGLVIAIIAQALVIIVVNAATK
ncbi:MAG TPA: hypothetical protein VGE30_03705 [Candidatus Saccharimonadales bacterium]